jgi:hypothetical protein
MNLFSIELLISLLLSIIIGIPYICIQFTKALKEIPNLDCNLWKVILARHYYEKNGYFNFILIAFADWGITIFLLIYTCLMLLKFVGLHLSKNKKIIGHYWNDIIFIVGLCFFTRIISSYL